MKRILIIFLSLLSLQVNAQLATKMLITDKKHSGLTIYSKDNLICFGDSYTVGQQSSVPALAYPKLFQSYIGGSILMNAQGGRGLWLMADVANTTFTTLTSGVITAMAGLNDYRRSGTNSKTDNKLVGAYNTLMVNSWAKTYYPNNGGTGWTVTGSWSGTSNTAAKNTLYTNTGAGTLTKTISGKNLAFVFMGSDGTATYGTVTIKIDGTTYYNFSLNDKSDGITDGTNNGLTTPYSVCVFGLAAGSHTVEIDASSANCPFDYVAELADPSTDYMNKVLIAEIPHLTTAGYATAPSNANDAIIDAANILLDNTVAAFKNAGYPAAIVKTNNRLANPGDYYTDGIHPVDSGHEHLFEGFIDLINLVTTVRVFPNLTSTAFGGTYYQGRAASPWAAIGGSDISLPANTAGWVQTYVPNTTDCDFGMLGFNTTKEVATYTSYEYAGCYYNSPQALYTITNGASFLSRQAGTLTVGSKWRLERTSGMVIKLRYASDGVTFSDVYVWPGTNSSQLYLNIAFDATNKIAYNIETNGFY